MVDAGIMLMGVKIPIKRKKTNKKCHARLDAWFEGCQYDDFTKTTKKFCWYYTELKFCTDLTPQSL